MKLLRGWIFSSARGGSSIECRQQICSFNGKRYIIFLTHRKIRLIEVNAKCHLKKFSCKGTSRQVFIRVNRLEIANFMRTFKSYWHFQPRFVICTLPCCPSPLLSGSTLPPSPPFLVCGGGGVYGDLDRRQINPCRTVPLHQFFRRRYFALPSMTLIFLRFTASTWQHLSQPPVKLFKNTQGPLIYFFTLSLAV